MRWSALTAAATAGIIVLPATAADVYTVTASGSFSQVFNGFLSPYENVQPGTAWELKFAFDRDIPGADDPSPNLTSFKESLCAFDLVIDGVLYGSDQFDLSCDLITTNDPCDCTNNTIEVTGSSGILGLSFHLIIADLGGMILPIDELPDTSIDLASLGAGSQFNLFGPGPLGSTAQAIDPGITLFIEAGKTTITPAPAAVTSFAGLALLASRRRRR